MPSQHTRDRGARDTLFIAALTASTFIISHSLLVCLSTLVPPFDVSHTINTSTSLPGLRWDAIHFLSIAKDGYEFEQQLAFQPGWQVILAAAGRAVARVGRGGDTVNDADLVQSALVINLIARVVANVYLYKLTRVLFSRRLAVATSLLYAFPVTPATVVSPYTEPIYAAALFSALFCSVTGQHVVAALLFAVTTSIRATGVLSCVILASHVLFAKCASPKSLGTYLLRIIKMGLLSLLVCAPFLAFQAYNYYVMCEPVAARPWCNLRLPLSYSWVQREYWNVGPFRYWTIEQLPNLLLATPVIFPTIAGIWQYLRRQPVSLEALSDPRLPIYVHQLVMVAILLLASHTQIALRLASTDPTVWWTVAASALRPGGSGQFFPSMGKFWIWWTCYWGIVSLVLWAGHYPPA